MRNASKHIPGNNINPYLSDIHCETLTIEEQENCDKTPLIEECNKALRSIKDNKSPWQDGLPVKILNIFWKEMKHIYYASLIKSIQKGTLPFSQRNAIISIIHKKDKKQDQFEKSKTYRYYKCRLQNIYTSSC